MIAKEWLEVRWKFVLIVTLAAMPVALISALYLPPYESAQRTVSVFPDRMALEQILNVYDGGGVALGFLAAFLGAVLVSGETSRETILFLLSKPVSRSRIMLTKYFVGASVLLLVAVLGHALLLVIAATKGYPLLGLLSFPGVVLSTVLLWLGTLFVLGAVFVVCVSLSNPSVSVVAAVLVAIAYWFAGTLGLNYSSSYGLYTGQSIAAMKFAVCSIAAALPLLLFLWLFNRKAY